MAVGEIPPPLFFERRALVGFKTCAFCRSGDSIFRNTPETDQRWPQWAANVNQPGARMGRC